MEMKVGRNSAVVFDIDGTLCNSFNLGYLATNTVLQKNGYQYTSEEIFLAGFRLLFPTKS
jgi:phosphoglycolate phosphatase-like HAD superfamily hydrolase